MLDNKFNPLDGILLNLAAFVVIIAGIKAAASIIIPFLLAAFLATIMSPLLFWLRDRKVPSGIAILMLIMMLLGIEIGVGALIGTSFKDFSQNLPFYQQRISEFYGQLLLKVKSMGIAEENLQVLKDIDPSRIMAIAATTLKRLGKLVTNTFFIFLTLLFMLLEAGGMSHKIRLMAMEGIGGTAHLHNILSGINNFFAIKTLTSLATGVLIGIALMIQGVDFPVLWGLIAFLLNYIPNIGSIIAAVPAVMLSFVQLGIGHSMVTISIFLAVNIGIGSIIEPRIMGTGVGLSPLVIFLSMAFWGWVLGPVGMLLSVPITMSLKIALSRSQKGRWLAIILGTNKEAENMISSTTGERQN